MPPVASSPETDAPDHRIVAVAQKHLLTYGYTALTMDDLAHELGMSKKTLYLHFPGKDAIIGKVIDGIGCAARAEMDTILGNPRLTFAQKLRAIVDVVAPRMALLNPAMMRELQRYAPKIFQKIDELRQKNIPYVFGRLFRDGIAEGAVRPDLDPDFAALFWLQAVRGMVHPDTLAHTGLTTQQTLVKSLELFTGGLLTPAGRKDHEKLFPR
jgi:AcrR family transcriptional regulator